MGLFSFIHQPRKPTGFLRQGAILPWYDTADLADASLEYPVMALQPGALWFEQDMAGYNISNGFQYVQQVTTVGAAGEIVTFVPPTTGTADYSESNNATVTLLTGTLTAGASVGSLVYFENNATTPTMRVVKANTATTITVSKRDPNNTFSANDADALPFVPLESSNCAVFNPYLRTQGNATMPIAGISLGTTANGQWGPVQVAGINLVKCSGNNANQALTAWQPLVPGPAGVAVGANNQAAAAPSTWGYHGGSNIIPIYVSATGINTQLIPCLINCTNTI